MIHVHLYPINCVLHFMKGRLLLLQELAGLRFLAETFSSVTSLSYQITIYHSNPLHRLLFSGFSCFQYIHFALLQYFFFSFWKCCFSNIYIVLYILFVYFCKNLKYDKILISKSLTNRGDDEELSGKRSFSDRDFAGSTLD